MVVYRTSVVLVLELNDSHILEVRVSVFHPHDELLEVCIARFDILDVERLLIIESECNELGTTIEVHTDQLPNAISACALSLLVIMLCISAVTLMFAAAFGIQFFIPPNLNNAFCDNDFLVVFFRILSPQFSANSHRIIKSSSSAGGELRARLLAARIRAGATYLPLPLVLPCKPS